MATISVLSAITLGPHRGHLKFSNPAPALLNWFHPHRSNTGPDPRPNSIAMAHAPEENSTIPDREERVVNSYLDQGPKAFFIMLTHRQATSLEKSVRDKERVTRYDIGDPQLELVMWSAVPTDAETIRKLVKVAHKRLSRRPLMEVIIIILASVMAAALGGSIVWMALAYGPPGTLHSTFRALLVTQGMPRYNTTSFPCGFDSMGPGRRIPSPKVFDVLEEVARCSDGKRLRQGHTARKLCYLPCSCSIPVGRSLHGSSQTFDPRRLRCARSTLHASISAHPRVHHRLAAGRAR